MHLRPLLTSCNPLNNFATPIKGVYYNSLTYLYLPTVLFFTSFSSFHCFSFSFESTKDMSFFWNIICASYNPLSLSKWTPRTPEVLFLFSFLSFLIPQSIVPSTRKTLASLAYLVKDFQGIKRISKGRITKMDSLKIQKAVWIYTIKYLI